MFAKLPAWRRTTEEILRIVQLHAGEEDCRELVGWIEIRVGRAQALAGGPRAA
jgi:hypothetical protein